jgi:uncharacterized coiled-coil protein SlyX
VREMLEKRLNELKGELSAGESLLAELQEKQTSLRQTMLRISGAIQVLEEELRHADESRAAPVEALAEPANGLAPPAPTLRVPA